MKGHGSKRGKSLRMIARELGKETFEGKRCGCGHTTKKVTTGKCVNCRGAHAPARAPKESEAPIGLGLIAHRAFNLVAR